MKELLKQLSTPCFVLDEKILDTNLDSMKSSLSDVWGNYIVSFSYKTNSLPYLLKMLYQKGVYAEVVSETEYLLAKKIGYPSSQIVYNGPVKDEKSIKDALKNHAIFNVDSLDELDLVIQIINDKSNGILQTKLGLRVNFDLEQECPNETIMGKEPGRFGLNFENGELLQAIQRCRSANIEPIGLHLHTSTVTKSIRVFKALASMCVQVAREYELALDYIDIGGGFFGDKPNAPSYHDYFSSVAQILSEHFDPKSTKLIVEPGVALASSCISYLCKVKSTKQARKGINLQITDGSRMHVDSQFSGRQFVYHLITSQSTTPIVSNQSITGFTCIEKDRFLKLENQQLLQPGDMIQLMNAGSYTITFVPMFIEYMPRVYTTDDNVNFTLVRDRWTIEEYLQKSIY